MFQNFCFRTCDSELSLGPGGASISKGDRENNLSAHSMGTCGSAAPYFAFKTLRENPSSQSLLREQQDFSKVKLNENKIKQDVRARLGADADETSARR